MATFDEAHQYDESEVKPLLSPLIEFSSYTEEDKEITENHPY